MSLSQNSSLAELESYARTSLINGIHQRHVIFRVLNFSTHDQKIIKDMVYNLDSELAHQFAELAMSLMEGATIEEILELLRDEPFLMTHCAYIDAIESELRGYGWATHSDGVRMVLLF